ncbi:phage tail family protein [Cytobacillus sp. IB215665]|uniref:phage tail family protein n=1 Tax=Cytobacillus sp. IB215665 TaxID=3097357 RepID=UPI002A1414AD|nr:phage tail family protein [Cytobacillus sp. IB215665]MDX8367862.1 phage tail family protein [Cytobacillus sp. IB215665]
MQTVTFTNSRGQSVELKNIAPFVLSMIEGLGDVESVTQTQKSPFQHGTTYIDSELESRFIPIEISIVGTNESDISEKREYLSSVFNPTLGKGILRYENSRIVREIVAVSEHVPIYPSGDSRTHNYQVAVVDLICPDPFWCDVNPTNIKLEDFVSSFRFPFSFPVRFATRGDSRVLVNEGHVPTPVKITFRGESINPKITNQTTGKFIQINRSIPKDYTLVINTAFGNKTIEIIAPDGVTTNANGYMDLASEFFQLEVGENKINFITEGGKPEVYIEYKNRYLGV